MDKWKAFGQGAAVVPGIGSAAKQAASLAAASGPVSTDSTALPDGTTINTEVAKLLKKPANGTGMDALLRAVVYKQWEGLADHVSDTSFCKMTDKRGCTPLHLTVSHNGPLEVVQSLVETWPGAAAATDTDGATALHHAVAKRAAIETVATVLKANPGAVKLQSKMKLTVPAGESIAGGGLTQAIATSADATHGFTPLHWALLMRSTEIVDLMLEVDEDCGKASAAVACAAGRLPLHTAAANGATGETILKLIKAHPLGLKHADMHGATPLHHAAAHCAPIESMAELSTQNPAAVQAKAKNGWTPLHYLVACGDGATPEAARLLTNSWSGAVAACDNQGRTALHVAAASHAPIAVVNVLLQRWTGAAAAREKDAAGHTPLHWAAQKSSDPDIIRAVRAAYPAAITMLTSEDACTPVHLAASRGAAVTVEMMAELLKDADEHPALLLRSRHDFTPLHAAVKSGCSVKVIQLLTTLCPEACRVQATTGRTPLHIAALEALQRNLKVGRNSPSEISRECAVVLALIEVYPETVHLLQAFDKPAVSVKTRARGAGESGAAIVARLRNGDAGDAVANAVKKCQQAGNAVSDANAAELLAMVEREKEQVEKKKKVKSKRKKKKATSVQHSADPTAKSADDNEPTTTALEPNQPVVSERAKTSQITNHENDAVEIEPAIGDDGGGWTTCGGGKGRKIGRKGRAYTDAQQQCEEVINHLPEKHRTEASSNKPASTFSTTQRSSAQTASGEHRKSDDYKLETGTSAGGVMLMEELWDLSKPPHTHTAAPAVSNKLQLRTREKNIPAGLERQRAGKQLFMEALWATRGRGSQQWPTDLSRSHYPGFSSTQRVHGVHGVGQLEAEVCPQCGWRIGSSKPPKRKLLITDPATGAAIVAKPNDAAVQVPTGSSNMKDWNVSDVCEFVTSLLPGSKYSEIFREHEVDGNALSALNAVGSKGFELLGIRKYGHIAHIASAVAEHQKRSLLSSTSDVESIDTGTSTKGASDPENTRTSTERLQSIQSPTKAEGGGRREPGAHVLSGHRLGSPGKAGGVQSIHGENRLDLPAPPPNEFFCPISFGECRTIIGFCIVISAQALDFLPLGSNQCSHHLFVGTETLCVGF